MIIIIGMIGLCFVCAVIKDKSKNQHQNVSHLHKVHEPQDVPRQNKERHEVTVQHHAGGGKTTVEEHFKPARFIYNGPPVQFDELISP